jgi:hypothetical protein
LLEHGAILTIFNLVIIATFANNSKLILFMICLRGFKQKHPEYDNDKDNDQIYELINSEIISRDLKWNDEIIKNFFRNKYKEFFPQ